MADENTGLKAGIEIHQQLNTREKLFCRCPTVLRRFEDHSGELFRYLRATESELGEIDEAAKEEMKQERRFCYYTYDTTCLVENDEEPPSPLDDEALRICLTVAKIFDMTPVEQVHTMRKLVIDGSNTSGFQRTALVALDGTLPNGGRIETICLEEEAAQRVEDETFSLDRLGIPLVEITTSPCMHSPEDVQHMAQYLGMVLRSTGCVKRGLGTIRQDINISIRGGARVEVKGVQELDLIGELVRREVCRQQALLEIRSLLREREASVERDPVDVTSLFSGTGSSILRNARTILAVRLKGFAGVVGRELQPGRRLGSELSDYAKKCGVGGIFHTDELPAYGITAGEVTRLREYCSASADDCIAIVAASPGKAACAARQVIRRAEAALAGVPEETRKMLEGGNSAYMRPLPGAARMYPETDVLPVRIDRELWSALPLPELISLKADRFTREYGFDPAVSRQIAYSEDLPLFEKAIERGISPNLVARTLATRKELSREGVDISKLT
ncbi:MAG: Glu-tRNA(Gln) amidotransferase subunit GatE, partial [Methanoregulaceae archaeon]|nr:Glu-tRNA(Gln) amidotransferase subunit GatE [Methanoregulaceae archaeon]